MKIVQLSTSDMGGAGIAAKRLHLALLEKKIDSVFISKVSLDPANKANYILQTEKNKSLAERFITRTGSALKGRLPLLNNNLNQYYFDNKRSGFEYFSFPFADTEIELKSVPALEQADIIHLHWIADNFVDYKNIMGLSNKQYVWTLHDMNPFTGGCHHSDGCKKFEKNCNYCFQLEGTRDEYVSSKILNYKLDALRHLRDDQLKIITPSSWLGKLSSQSSCFSRFEHFVIPNIIDFETDTTTRETCRLELGISNDEICLLFIAHSVDNPRKRIHLLKRALEGIEDKDRIRLITIGQKGALNFEGIKITELGFITDKETMQKAYKAADVFLLPSVAENFPNTVVESLLCGTPVIASDTGGIPEQINEKNGILVKVNDEEEWVTVLSKFVNGEYKFVKENIQKDALSRYNKEEIVNKHLELYNKTIKD